VQTIRAQEGCVLLKSNVIQMRVQSYARKREEFLLIQPDENN